MQTGKPLTQRSAAFREPTFRWENAASRRLLAWGQVIAIDGRNKNALLDDDFAVPFGTHVDRCRASHRIRPPQRRCCRPERIRLRCFRQRETAPFNERRSSDLA
jgi:hypothetical protein